MRSAGPARGGASATFLVLVFGLLAWMELAYASWTGAWQWAYRDPGFALLWPFEHWQGVASASVYVGGASLLAWRRGSRRAVALFVGTVVVLASLAGLAVLGYVLGWG
jgi:hypothetical protein